MSSAQTNCRLRSLGVSATQTVVSETRTAVSARQTVAFAFPSSPPIRTVVSVCNLRLRSRRLRTVVCACRLSSPQPPPAELSSAPADCRLRSCRSQTVVCACRLPSPPADQPPPHKLPSTTVVSENRRLRRLSSPHFCRLRLRNCNL